MTLVFLPPNKGKGINFEKKAKSYVNISTLNSLREKKGGNSAQFFRWMGGQFCFWCELYLHVIICELLVRLDGGWTMKRKSWTVKESRYLFTCYVRKCEQPPHKNSHFLLKSRSRKAAYDPCHANHAEIRKYKWYDWQKNNS